MMTILQDPTKPSGRGTNSTKILRAALAGVVVATAAPGAAIAQSTRLEAPAVIQATMLFRNLKRCEIPGVRERVVARGVRTVVFAGEFLPTSAIPWVAGNARIVLYVVSGTGVIRVGHTSTNAGPGDVFVLPRGVRHAVSASSVPLRALYFEDRS